MIDPGGGNAKSIALVTWPVLIEQAVALVIDYALVSCPVTVEHILS